MIGGCLYLLVIVLLFALMIGSFISIIVAGPMWVSLLFMAMLLLPWLLQDS
jgi:hypothetical protein